MSTEVELKLAIERSEVGKLLRHPLILAHATSRPRRLRLLSIYYDTPDWRLHRQHAAVRLRKAGRRWLQTVKAGGHVAAGLHSRPEWEVPTRAGQLRLESPPEGAMRELLADQGLCAALAPMFTTQFTRTLLILEWPEGDRVELAIDRGEVRAEVHAKAHAEDQAKDRAKDQAKERVLPICEVELELKAGRPARLFELAESLCADIRMQLCNVSKAERGQRLAAGADLVARKASSPVLAPDLSAGAACVAVLGNALSHLQGNEEGARCTDAPEFIHQMRVATRRLRCALGVFESLMDADVRTSLLDELAWLGQALDGARNWDVFMDETLPRIRAAISDDAGLDWLVARGEAERRKHRRLARAALESLRYQRLLLKLGAWLAEPSWHAMSGGRVADPAQVVCAQLLQSAHARLRRRGRNFGKLDFGKQHRLRITAKKQRYSAEYFASLYPGRRIQRYIKVLGRLQDILGAINDAVTAVGLMQQLAHSARGGVRHRACGLVTGWLLGHSQIDARSAASAWKAFARCKRFWPRVKAAQAGLS